MKKRTVEPWFPFWIDKWLFGSTRIELEPDERGVFVDLISLSKKDSGYIRANEGIPYLESQLCGLLNIKPELFQRTVKKCIKYGKAKKLKNGTLYMTSYEVYSLSSRQERRINGEMSKKTDTMAKKADTNINIKRNINIKKNIKNKKRIKPKTLTPKPKMFDEVDIKLNQILCDLILKNDPKSKVQKMTPTTQETWSNECRKLREIDKRTPDEIKFVIEWTQQDSFEKTNVLSMTKLRKRFSQLFMKAKRDKGYDKYVTGGNW